MIQQNGGSDQNWHLQRLDQDLITLQKEQRIDIMALFHGNKEHASY
jgi:hypothetical protein